MFTILKNNASTHWDPSHKDASHKPFWWHYIGWGMHATSCGPRRWLGSTIHELRCAFLQLTSTGETRCSWGIPLILPVFFQFGCWSPIQDHENNMGNLYNYLIIFVLKTNCLISLPWSNITDGSIACQLVAGIPQHHMPKGQSRSSRAGWGGRLGPFIGGSWVVPASKLVSSCVDWLCPVDDN